jgi:molybdate-binding protein
MLTAAWRVLTGTADCCPIAQSSANIMGLDFIPAAERQFSLILRKTALPAKPLADILAILRQPEFRRDMETHCSQNLQERTPS